MFHCQGARAQCWCKKGGSSNGIGHSRGGASIKIHTVVDSYGNPVRLMESEGQRHYITYSIPLFAQIEIEGSRVLAGKGYDSK